MAPQEAPPHNAAAAQVIEERQHGLVLFLIVVTMLILGAILVLTWSAPGHAVPMLCLSALAACLYAAVQDRRLRRSQLELEDSLDAKSRVMDRMGKRLRQENARSKELGTRLDDLTRLYRAISAVNSVADPESAYDVVVRAGIQLVKADTGSLMLIEDGGKTLALRSAVGLPDAVLANNVIRRVGEGVSGWVAQHGESLLLTGEADDDPRFENTISDTGIEFSLCVPLIHAHQVLGVLSLGISEPALPDDSGERTLGASHQSMANIFAQHAAVTVLNSRLLEGRIDRDVHPKGPRAVD